MMWSLLALSVADLQLSLDQFPAEREAIRIRISTSKSEVMDLSRKRVECRLQAGKEILIRSERVQVSLGLFREERENEWEVNKRPGVASAVMWTPPPEVN